MITDIAKQRYKILQFYEKYGLEATIEAFDVSRRTLYRWKSMYQKNNHDITSLNPKSTKPKRVRKTDIPKKIIDEIKQLREDYPNLGKDKLYHILKPWCKAHQLPVLSASSIGRVISSHKDKMRVAPLRIDHYGKTKQKKRKFKNRKPKNLTAQLMHLWAVDTIQKVSNGIRKYIMTMIDPHSRVAFAVAIPTKHTLHTARVLETLIEGLTGTIALESKPKSFAILSDNGSEFMKDFEALIEKKGLTHYWTYPRSPKMNAHNERFNRTIQEQFIYYHEELLFTDMEYFNQLLADWLIDYNTFIPHHSLNMKTPVQYLIDYNNECHMLWTNTRS